MAGVKFSGDSHKLARLISGMEKLSSKGFRRALNRDLAAESLELAHDGFSRSITPYGQRWKNPVYRVGQPLRDTGRLEASIRPISTAEDFSLLTNVVYGATHQYGRGPIPKRQFLPDGRSGFGSRWRKALFAIAHEHVTDALGR